MDSTIPKPWLTPEQQVEHLKGEGVKFEIVQGSDAVTYLRNNNNFFRINQFKKGFPRYSGGKNDGKFINLDFAMLKDLAIIDYEFRQILLAVTIDIEHFAKIQLLDKLEQRGEDGYSIVSSFLESNDRCNKDGSVSNYVKTEIDRGKSGCYTNDLVARYPSYDYPVWVFMELIPFGTFNQFVQFVAGKYSDKKLRNSFYRLQSVKSLRNACGHNNCILDDMKSGRPSYQVSYDVKNALRAAGFSETTLKTKMSNERLQQISTALYLHHSSASDGVVAAKGDQLRYIVKRMYRNIEYYEKNDVLKGSVRPKLTYG